MKSIKLTLFTALLTLVMGLGTAHAAISWVVSPDAMAFGNTVIVGLNEIGLGYNANQPQGIYGAGFTMTGLTGGAIFDADLWTWDSYNASAGYWDAFVVNVNTNNYYWNLGGLSDPIASSAPGATWSWGGNSWSDQTLENYFSLGNPEKVEIIGDTEKTYYVSVVLDTKTNPQSDSNHPSWGSFHVTPVPEPTSMALLGMGILGLFGLKRRKS